MANGMPTSEPDLASIPMAQGGLARLAVARLNSAGLSVTPLGRRAGLTPELIAEPDKPLSVRSQIAFLDEAAIALKDVCFGFTLAREHDPRGTGLLYYVMASSRTLGEALQRLARYSKVTNEAVVFGYREGNRLITSLSYSGVPRHSDRHQMEFCMFAAIRICRLLTGRMADATSGASTVPSASGVSSCRRAWRGCLGGGGGGAFGDIAYPCPGSSAAGSPIWPTTPTPLTAGTVRPASSGSRKIAGCRGRSGCGWADDRAAVKRWPKDKIRPRRNRTRALEEQLVGLAPVAR